MKHIKLLICLTLVCVVAFSLVTSTYAIYQKTFTLESSGTITVDWDKIHPDEDEISYQDVFAWFESQLADSSTTTGAYFANKHNKSLDSTNPNVAPTINEELNDYLGTNTDNFAWKIQQKKRNNTTFYKIFFTNTNITGLTAGETIPETVYKYTTNDGIILAGNTTVQTKKFDGIKVNIINDKKFNGEEIDNSNNPGPQTPSDLENTEPEQDIVLNISYGIDSINLSHNIATQPQIDFSVKNYTDYQTLGFNSSLMVFVTIDANNLPTNHSSYPLFPYVTIIDWSGNCVSIPEITQVEFIDDTTGLFFEISPSLLFQANTRTSKNLTILFQDKQGEAYRPLGILDSDSIFCTEIAVMATRVINTGNLFSMELTQTPEPYDNNNQENNVNQTGPQPNELTQQPSDITTNTQQPSDLTPQTQNANQPVDLMPQQPVTTNPSQIPSDFIVTDDLQNQPNNGW